MTKTRPIIAFCLCAAIIFSGCAGQRFYPAPSLMPNTERYMKVPAFWISSHPDPDRVILNSKAIKRFNRNIQDDLRLTNDLKKFRETYSGVLLRKEIRATLNGYKKGKFYTMSWKKPGKDFFSKIEQNINAGAIQNEISVRYGLVSHYASQRVLPTPEGLYSNENKIDFDILQNNSLDIGRPVAVLAKTLDGKWLYTVSEHSDGWVESENIALCSKKLMISYITKEPFAVIIKAKGQIMLDPGLLKYFDYVRLGSRLRLVKNAKKTPSGAATVLIPSRAYDGSLELKKAFIQEKEINRGYLSYTPRNIILEAFEMQDTAYGWGGMYGEQDCSGFIQQVFATTGIDLPKNSYSQSEVGKLIRSFTKKADEKEKIDVLERSALAGATILYFSGHVMLYLGEVNNTPYVIHDIWGYSEKFGGSESVRVINHIVVSDLSLGEGTKKGSLLKRLKTIRTVS